MTSATVEQHRDELRLELQGLVLVRALLELRGFAAEEIARHDRRTSRVRAELADLEQAA